MTTQWCMIILQILALILSDNRGYLKPGNDGCESSNNNLKFELNYIDLIVCCLVSIKYPS